MLKNRSSLKELIDLGPDYYSKNEYIDWLKKIFLVNQLLGNVRRTKKLIKNSHVKSVLDIGCGGGHFLFYLSRYFPHVQLKGCDISEEAIAFAKFKLKIHKKHYSNLNVSFNLQDQSQIYSNKNYDVILANLLCHHLSNDELIIFLKKLYQISSKMIIINDLHRHFLAYISYTLLSPLFCNRLIRIDGKISIKRGFVRSEWLTILKKAEIQHYKLKWRFPFQWQLIIFKN